MTDPLSLAGFVVLVVGTSVAICLVSDIFADMSQLDKNARKTMKESTTMSGIGNFYRATVADMFKSMASKRKSLELWGIDDTPVVGGPSLALVAVGPWAGRLKAMATGWAQETKDRKIVCLCGSTRFMDAFQIANFQETLAGNIVLSVGCNTKSDVGLGLTPEIKAELDELHLRKIDLADEVLVLNVDGYVGESTRREIEYASGAGKAVRYLVAETPL